MLPREVQQPLWNGNLLEFPSLEDFNEMRQLSSLVHLLGCLSGTDILVVLGVVSDNLVVLFSIDFYDWVVDS